MNAMYEQIELKKVKPCGYCRKSQDGEDRQALSIPAQIEEIERTASFHRLKTPDKIFTESRSALTHGNRPTFREMVTAIKKGHYNAVVCWKLDRIARNMDEGGEIIDLLQKGIIKAIITPQKIYFPNENAILLAVEFGSANQYSRDISINVKRGQAKKARMGFPHGVAKIGYTNDKTEEKGNRKWTVDRVRLPLVKACFELFLTGAYSGGKIWRYATEELKLTTPKHKKLGGKLLGKSYLYTMLKDPIYAGFFYQNGERYELHPSLPRIITEEEHDRVVRMLGSSKAMKTQVYDATYSGFIKSPIGETIGPDFKDQVICDCKKKFSYRNRNCCPECKAEIEAMENPKYLHYRFYYNTTRKKRGMNCKSVEEKKIQGYLINFFDENLPLPKSLIEWSIRYLKEVHDNELEQNQAAIKSQDSFIENIETRKKRLRDLLISGTLSDDDYKEEILSLEKEKAVHANKEYVSSWFERAKEILVLSNQASYIFDKGTKKQQRELIGRLRSNLTWNEQELNIINTKSVNALIEGIKRSHTEIERFEPKNTLDIQECFQDFKDKCPSVLPIQVQHLATPSPTSIPWRSARRIMDADRSVSNETHETLFRLFWQPCLECLISI